MKVSAAIAAGRAYRNNAAVTDGTIMGWLASLDQDLAIQAGENYSSANVPVVAGTSLYDMPEGFSWDNITGMWLDDYRMPKLSGAAYGKKGVSLVGGQLSIYPIPTADMTLHIRQQGVRTAYTDAANDDLFLPEPYSKAYAFYVAGHIYFVDRAMDMYNNMILRFNNEIDGFWRRRAQVGESDGLAVTGLW